MRLRRLKPSKDLPAGWWATQVAKFEGATVGGAKRRFPQQQLLAAEAILGRMVFEAKTETQTALGLHEIVQARFFNSAGEPISLHKDRRKLKLPTTVVNADHQLQAEPETAWHPKSTLAFLDCLESIRWAWALTETGPEPAIDRMTEGFSRKVRVHSNKLEQLRSYWETISWKIALGLRSKEKFADIVDIVINSIQSLQQALNREPATEKPARKHNTDQRQVRKERAKARTGAAAVIAGSRTTSLSPAAGSLGRTRRTCASPGHNARTKSRDSTGHPLTGAGPDQVRLAPNPQFLQQQSRAAKRRKEGKGPGLILLSFFDGIGSAPKFVRTSWATSSQARRCSRGKATLTLPTSPSSTSHTLSTGATTGHPTAPQVGPQVQRNCHHLRRPTLP